MTPNDTETVLRLMSHLAGDHIISAPVLKRDVAYLLEQAGAEKGRQLNIQVSHILETLALAVAS